MLGGWNELEPWDISVEWDANSAVGRGSQCSAKPRSLIGLDVGYRCNLWRWIWSGRLMFKIEELNERVEKEY